MNLFKSETEAISRNKQIIGKWCSSEKFIDFEREVAISREFGQPKQYVQDLIIRDAVNVYELWQNKGGYIYVCGKAQMAEEVRKALIDILTHIGNIYSNAATTRLEDMRTLHRYQEDIFSYT